MSWISDFLEPIDYRTSRIIYEYLRSSKSKSFGKLTIEIGRETILEIEWMGYSPDTANRHTHCRVKTGRIHDVVIPIAQIPAFAAELRESMEHKHKAEQEAAKLPPTRVQIGIKRHYDRLNLTPGQQMPE
jgi:hypothetical protein